MMLAFEFEVAEQGVDGGGRLVGGVADLLDGEAARAQGVGLEHLGAASGRWGECHDSVLCR